MRARACASVRVNALPLSSPCAVQGATAAAEEADVAAAERAAAAGSAAAAGAPADEVSAEEAAESAAHALRTAAAEAGSTGVIPTGRVVGILKRAWRQYCGSLEVDEAEAAAWAGAGAAVGPADGAGVASSALFVPVDARIPRIRIDTRQRAALADKRLLVAIDGWDAGERYPRGHYVRTLGPIGDRTTETEVRGG